LKGAKGKKSRERETREERAAMKNERSFQGGKKVKLKKFAGKSRIEDKRLKEGEKGIKKRRKGVLRSGG